MMNNHFLLTDDMLWDYADGLLPEDMRLQVDAYLQQHPEHRGRLSAIQAEKNAWSALPLEKPNKGFADRVMAAWVSEQAAVKIKAVAKPDRILSAIAGVFLVFLLIVLVLTIMAAPYIPVNVPTAYIPQMPAYDFVGFFGNPALRYGLMLLVAYLGLQILEKYLQQRKRLELR